MTDKEYVDTKLQVDDLLDEGEEYVRTYIYGDTFAMIHYKNNGEAHIVRTFMRDKKRYWMGYYGEDNNLKQLIKNRELPCVKKESC